jgi:hypothetical protein
MRSYLVVGNQTLASPELATAIGERDGRRPDRFPRRRPGDARPEGLHLGRERGAGGAQGTARRFVGRLSRWARQASGEIGSRDPIEAVQDALRGHPVDEIILSTLPSGISRWLGQDVPTRASGFGAGSGHRW